MKRNLLLSLLVIVATFFTGCFETTEELTINENGSGTYNVNINLSGLFAFMDSMKGMDSTATTEKNKEERMDTTVYMRSFTDTASKLTAAQKELLRPAVMKMVMDEKEKEFKMDLKFPFSKLSDLEKIIALSKSEGGSNVMGKMVMPGEVVDNGSAPKLPDLSNYYDMTLLPNLVERKLNKEKYKSLNEDMQKNNMEEGGAEMLSSIKMNTVIHLPRPAKKVTGAGVKLSDDKKTITVKGTMEDLQKNPQAFTYRIEY
jgi:hypothetical protein